MHPPPDGCNWIPLFPDLGILTVAFHCTCSSSSSSPTIKTNHSPSPPGGLTFSGVRPPPMESGDDELRPHEKKALLDFRAKLEEAITTNQLLRQCHHDRSRTRVANSSSSAGLCPIDPKHGEFPADVSLWGVPLLPSKCHEGTDVILLKFLRAREFKVYDALEMLRRTLRWRRRFEIDGILEEEEELLLPGSKDLKNASYIGCTDEEGHPVCYNNYGVVFSDQELYGRVFGDEEGRERFLRWRVRSMEKDIKQLSFKPGGVGSMVQITDLGNSLNPGRKELRSTVKKIVSIFQDNYPEFVSKNIFVNVSFRYYSYHALFSHLFSQRTRSKLILARPSKVTETLLKFIAPENIPVQYGGFKREDDEEFSDENGKVSEMVVRGGCMGTIKIPILEPGVTVVWDLTVVGWEVEYKEEFIPDDEGSYRVLIRKESKVEGSVRSSFYINEPGKVVLTIDNHRILKKKRVLYRSKTKPTVPLYNLINQAHRPAL